MKFSVGILIAKSFEKSRTTERLYQGYPEEGCVTLLLFSNLFLPYSIFDAKR